MLQQDFQQQQVKISLQQDLNYRKQQPDFVSGINCGGLKNNCHKCGLKQNEKILHNFNKEKKETKNS